MGQLQKVSNDKKDYVKDGFYAARQADEMKCPDLEVNQLVSMQNVARACRGRQKWHEGQGCLRRPAVRNRENH
jgi:hypothetical protein